MASNGAELPRIDGFLFEDGPGTHPQGLLTPRMRNMFITILGCKHFSRRSDASSTRFYTNLVVLYRMLLFYGDLRVTPSFWNHVRNDWGLAAAVPDAKVAALVNYFTDARLRSKSMGDACPETLLMRLAGRWAELRGGGSRTANVDNTWVRRRETWARLRDTALGTLLDPKQVLCPLEGSVVQAQASSHQHRPEPQPNLVTSHGYYHLQGESRPVSALAGAQRPGPLAAAPVQEQKAWVPKLGSLRGRARRLQQRHQVSSRRRAGSAVAASSGTFQSPLAPVTPMLKREASSPPRGPTAKRACPERSNGPHAGPTAMPAALAWLPSQQLVGAIPRVRIKAEEAGQEPESPASSMAGSGIDQDSKMSELYELMRVHAPMFMDYLQRRQREEQQQQEEQRRSQHHAVQGGVAEAAAAAMSPLGGPSAEDIQQLAQRVEHLEERLDEEITHIIAAGYLSDDANRYMLQNMWGHIAAITGDAEALDMAMEY